MNAAEVVGRTLAELGVRDAFGVLGSGNFIATLAMHASGAAFHHARHEDGALCMADGYARVSGRLGVCSVHQGPGLTNAITGLTEAAKSRTPLLLLARRHAGRAAALELPDRPGRAGRVRRRGRRAGALGPATAVADTARAVRRARGRAAGGRAELPLDVQAAGARARAAARRRAASPPRPSPAGHRGGRRRCSPRAERPVIIAGRGAVLSGARGRAAGARRAHRRGARHLRGRQRAVRRRPVRARDLRRLRHAARRSG